MPRMYIAAIFVFVFGIASVASAATVQLKDGSVVVGSIIGLTDGEDLVVDTEHMDEVVIEWEAVERIADTEILDVELYDGSRYAGTLSREGSTVEIDGDSPLRITAQSDGSGRRTRRHAQGTDRSRW